MSQLLRPTDDYANEATVIQACGKYRYGRLYAYGARISDDFRRRVESMQKFVDSDLADKAREEVSGRQRSYCWVTFDPSP